jgi:hypothetical protein
MPDLNFLIRQAGPVAVIGVLIWGGVQLIIKTSSLTWKDPNVVASLALFGFAALVAVFYCVAYIVEITGRHYQALIDAYDKATSALARGVKQGQVKAPTSTSKSASANPNKTDHAPSEIEGYTLQDASFEETAAE